MGVGVNVGVNVGVGVGVGVGVSVGESVGEGVGEGVGVGATLFDDCPLCQLHDHCNKLQHAAAQCSTLHHIATHNKTLPDADAI